MPKTPEPSHDSGVPSTQERQFEWERHFAQGKPSGSRRRDLICAFLPLVRSIAIAIHQGLPPHVPLDDLISAGTVGLIDTVDRYDPANGGNFPKYASIRIRGAVLDELRAADWAPSGVRQTSNQIRSIRQQLEGQLGRSATGEEVAHAMGLAPEQFQNLLRKTAPRRLVGFHDIARAARDDDMDPMEHIEDPTSPDPLEASEEREDQEILEQVIQTLKKRGRQVLSLLYFDGLSGKDLAQLFEITEGRVSQIHHEAMATLRKRLPTRSR